MARIRNKAPAAGFAPIAEAAIAHHTPTNTKHDTRKDCSVKAMVALLGITYDEAFATFAKAGRITGRATPQDVTTRAYALRGFRLQSVFADQTKRLQDAYQAAGREIEHLTTYHPRRFPSLWADQPNMLITVRKHAAAFVKGEVIDWSATAIRRVRDLQVLVPMSKPEQADAQKAQAAFEKAQDDTTALRAAKRQAKLDRKANAQKNREARAAKKLATPATPKAKRTPKAKATPKVTKKAAKIAQQPIREAAKRQAAKTQHSEVKILTDEEKQAAIAEMNGRGRLVLPPAKKAA
jgi:hypothetical protein